MSFRVRGHLFFALALCPLSASSHCVSEFAAVGSDKPVQDSLLAETYVSLLKAYSIKLDLKELRRIEKLPDLFDVDAGTEQDLMGFKKTLDQFREYLVEVGKDKPGTYQQFREILRQRIAELELAQEKLDRAIAVNTVVMPKMPGVLVVRDDMLNLVADTYVRLLDQLGPGLTPAMLRKMVVNDDPFTIPDEFQNDSGSLRKRLLELKKMADARAAPELVHRVLIEELWKKLQK